MYEKLEKVINDVMIALGYEYSSKVIKSNISGVDFQCDDAFKMAKVYHKSPFDIASEIASKLENIEYFKEVYAQKPGFINIVVTDKFINDSLREVIKSDKFGVKLENKKIIIDYGGPNVAKPLHVGHLRSAIIGQAINNILSFMGNEVISDVHLGDIGTQMGQVIYGILKDFPDGNYEKIDLNYLNVTYPKISALCKEDDLVKKECGLITKKLQEGNEEYRRLWKIIREISIKDIKRLYDYLSVKFDYWYGESDSYKYFDELIKYLDDEKILKLDDGAKVVYVKEDEDKIEIPPCLIQKSDGAYLYATSDLGSIWQRKKDFNPDDIIYIADNRQSMHFLQVFRVARKSHMFLGDLEHHGFGTVNGKDNKPFKTRAGDALKLDDLINEVKKEFINLREENKNMSNDDLDKIVNSILKFADLQNDLTRNYIFDIKKFSEVNGKTGPYILYTYLRINKLLEDVSFDLSDNIYSDTDRLLRLKLLDVTSVIELSAKERRPHYIAMYLYELSVIANNFYQNNYMSSLSGQIKSDLINVLTFNNKVIEVLLNLLGIYIPRAM